MGRRRARPCALGLSSALTSLVTVAVSAVPACVGLLTLVRKEQEEATVTPQTINPKPRNSKPETRNPEPETRNPKP